MGRPLETLRQRWIQLSQRERALLTLAGIALTLAIGYAALWKPLHQAHERAERRLTRALDDWQWLTATLAVTPPPAADAFRPLTRTAVEKSLAKHGLRTALTRMQSRPDGRLALRFENASAQTLMQWLRTVRRHGWRPEKLTLIPTRAGKVNADAIFPRGGA